jgi:hypothetical protein
MMKLEALPAKEFLVIKGYGNLYDPDVDAAYQTHDTWGLIREKFANGSVERLKKAAGSNKLYMLFCYTCVRDDANKCYACSYDIAFENINGSQAGDFDIVRLNACEYAAYDCGFDSEISLKDAHEPADELFWGEDGWLTNSAYTCAIDDPANWNGSGYAQIERYTPFEIDAKKFNMKIWYPLLFKKISGGNE